MTSPLFKSYVDGYTIGEIENNRSNGHKTPDEPMITTLGGKSQPMSQCFPVIRKGKVVGWQRI